MKVLVIGGGGREHALTWAISRDSAKPEIFCAPGNPGTAALATNLPIAAENLDALIAWAEKERPALTVVGPEAPLCMGITDRFESRGLKVFGPSQAAAQLEGSKVFSKEVMLAAGVPTAAYQAFSDPDQAIRYLASLPDAPVVVKAEGLAAGKGVFVCTRRSEAESAVRQILAERLFGEAGTRVVIEEFLEGEEASILALIDGQNIAMLASAQDHKRVFDADAGPNTGGMGAYSPAPVVTPDLWPLIREQVFDRTLTELRKRGIVYRGVLYAGLMMTATGPKVLEFNCRFGDPETQTILPRLDCDILPLLNACADGNLSAKLLRWKPEASACVVMAAGGYPGAYRKGDRIDGLAEAGNLRDVVVFHAGTATQQGATVTAGGRVLGVTATGPDLRAAVKQAYQAVDRIRFEGAHFRKDIAARAFGR